MVGAGEEKGLEKERLLILAPVQYRLRYRSVQLFLGIVPKKSFPGVHPS